MEDKEPEPEPEQKEPINMTTDEALEYIFAPEIVAELKREAGLDGEESDITDE
ncbi:MAG TPA: hypothetical protein VJ784_03160 [Pyrinomonadaceae bacterium]|nr:hypothetical protein [Pyrinomonadaceae bacterium]